MLENAAANHAAIRETLDRSNLHARELEIALERMERKKQEHEAETSAMLDSIRMKLDDALMDRMIDQ